jgi:hypothetical protein
MAKMFGCSHRTPLKRGYRLRDDAQVPTRPVTIREIMEDPTFTLGVADVRAGRGYPADYEHWGIDHQWNYERGRSWARVAPRHVPLKVNGRVTPSALRWYRPEIL